MERISARGIHSMRSDSFFSVGGPTLQDLAGGCLLGDLAVLDQAQAGRPAVIVGP